MPSSELIKIVQRVIALAKAVEQARSDAEPPGVEPGGGIASPFPPGWDKPKPRLPESVRLDKYLASQPADVVYALLALTYFAQGTTRSPKRLGMISDQMRRTYRDPSDAILQLMGRTRRLEAALQKASKYDIDLDATLPKRGRHGR